MPTASLMNKHSSFATLNIKRNVSNQGARRRQKKDWDDAHRNPFDKDNKHDTNIATENRQFQFRRSGGSYVKKDIMKRLIGTVVLISWMSFLFFEYHVLSGNTDINGTNGSIPGGAVTNDGVNTTFGVSSGYDSIFCRENANLREKLDHNDVSEQYSINNSKPVFLWGIPSTSSSYEIGRRKLLRETYLDFDKQLRSYVEKGVKVDSALAKEAPDDSNRICSLHDFICNERVQAECQMVYIFFVAGHKNDTQSVPPILLNESITDFRDMLLPYDADDKASALGSQNLNLHEPGTVYLNIRENQFDGKMTTWFKFASLVAKEYNSRASIARPIEYVFKVDSDLLLLTPRFFEWFDSIHKEQQERQKQRTSNFESPSALKTIHTVYGGIEFPDSNCIVNYTFDHPCPLPLSGPSYMSGELNFCSVDLATYIASDDCPRDKWTIPHEDVSLSNYIYSYQNNTAYHRKIGITSRGGTEDIQQLIDVVSVNTSRILLLPNMKADWYPVNVKKNPEVLTSGELLWGHSIKRSNHSQYLYWKKDPKFKIFWKFFFKKYTSPDRGRNTTQSATNSTGKAERLSSLNKMKNGKGKHQFELFKKRALERLHLRNPQTMKKNASEPKT